MKRRANPFRSPERWNLRSVVGSAAVAALLIASASCWAEKVARSPAAGAEQLAALIDRRIEAGWAEHSLSPSPPADEATFLRRVSLDLVGRIASVAETRQFLREDSAEKRRQLVRRLVHSPEHARHMARFWRRLWIPEADTQTFEELVALLEPWLVDRLVAGERYDHLVRDLLMASAGLRGESAGSGGGLRAPPVFAAASSNSPANLAANTTRAFLGVNLGCAQCHDHPDGRWTREQFWQTAAFFAPPEVDPSNRDAPSPPRLAIGDSGRVVEAVFLGGRIPRWSQDLERDSGRRELARWMIEPGNRYFARNGVNRLWAKFFGRGLVQPEDDLSAADTAAHARLLDELADAFTASGFDLRLLTEAIVLSRPYQLASRETGGGGGAGDADWFAAMPVRGLTGEQLYDSLRTAAGFSAERVDLQPERARRERESFAERFAVADPMMAERSIAQTLTLFNGQPVSRFTSPQQSPLLVALLDAPFLDSETRLETLFLAALNRPPGPAERARLLDYLKQRTSADAESIADAKSIVEAERYADLLWVLFNSSEFNSIQ